MYKIMTPGPTQVKENVRMARSFPCTNPDLDETQFQKIIDANQFLESSVSSGNVSTIVEP